MAGGTKPKRRRQVWERLNPLTVAINAATLLTERERTEILQPIREALDALRRGVCTPLQMVHLGVCCQMAMTIEKQGIVRGLRQQISEADQALYNIDQRAHSTGRWVPPTCYGHELVTISSLVEFYGFQISQLSAKEFRSSVAVTRANVRTFGKVVMA